MQLQAFNPARKIDRDIEIIGKMKKSKVEVAAAASTEESPALTRTRAVEGAAPSALNRRSQTVKSAKAATSTKRDTSSSRSRLAFDLDYKQGQKTTHSLAIPNN